MAQTYNQTATAGPSAGQFCTGNATANTGSVSRQASVGGTSGGESIITIDGNLTTGRAIYVKCVIPADSTWAAGNWSIDVNVTTAAANTTIEQCHVCRVNSSDVSQETLASSTGLGIVCSSTGVKNITVNQASQATPSAGDNVVIVLALTNSNSCTRTLGITFDQVITNAYATAATPIAGADSPMLGLSDTSAVGALMAKADTIPFNLTEISSSQVFISRPESLVVTVLDSSASAIFVGRSDDLSTSITESSAVDVVLTRGDTLVIVLGDSGLAEPVVGVTPKAGADTLVMGVLDAFNLVAFMDREDAIALPLTEGSAITVSIDTVADVIRLGSTESAAAFVLVAGVDAVAVALSELSSIISRLDRADALALGLADVASQLLAALTATDTPALVVSDASTLLIPQATTDVLGLHLTEDGVPVQVNVTLLGVVVAAQVATLVPARTVTAVARTVSYLGVNQRTLKVL